MGYSSDDDYKIRLQVWKDKLYTRDEVIGLFDEFIDSADFITFTKEYGVKGWDGYREWLKNNVK